MDDSVDRSKSDKDHSLKPKLVENTSNGVEHINDDLLLAKDPTLVLLEKPSSGSMKEPVLSNEVMPAELSPDQLLAKKVQSFQESSKGNTGDVEREDQVSSVPEENNTFSFGSGRQSLQKVNLCLVHAFVLQRTAICYLSLLPCTSFFLGILWNLVSRSFALLKQLFPYHACVCKGLACTMLLLELFALKHDKDLGMFCLIC